MLTLALVEFAKQGDTVSLDFLRRLVSGKVRVDSVCYGDSAVRIAKQYLESTMQSHGDSDHGKSAGA